MEGQRPGASREHPASAHQGNGRKWKGRVQWGGVGGPGVSLWQEHWGAGEDHHKLTVPPSSCPGWSWQNQLQL